MCVCVCVCLVVVVVYSNCYGCRSSLGIMNRSKHLRATAKIGLLKIKITGFENVCVATMANSNTSVRLAGICVGAAAAVGILIYLDRQVKRANSTVPAIAALVKLCTTPLERRTDKSAFFPDEDETETRTALQQVGSDKANVVLGRNVGPSAPYTPLYAAIILGKVAVVKAILEMQGCNVDLNAAAEGSPTSLYVASSNGRAEMAKLLLNVGSPGSVANKSVSAGTATVTPLTKANKMTAFIGACLGCTAGNAVEQAQCFEVAKVFYSVLGAQFVCSAVHLDSGSTALVIAVGRGKGNLQLVDMLLDAAATAAALPAAPPSASALAVKGVPFSTDQYADTPNALGLAPLHFAAAAGAAPVVQALLAANANPAVLKGKTNATPLHDASVNGHATVVNLLLRAAGNGGNDGSNGGGGESGGRAAAAAVAAAAAAARMLNLINQRNVNGLTALHGAASVGAVDVVDALLVANADPNVCGKVGGITPLHVASRSGHVAVVKALLNAGGARQTVLKATTEGGGAKGITVSETALDMAEANGHVEVAAILKRFYFKA